MWTWTLEPESASGWSSFTWKYGQILPPNRCRKVFLGWCDVYHYGSHSSSYVPISTVLSNFGWLTVASNIAGLFCSWSPQGHRMAVWATCGFETQGAFMRVTFWLTAITPTFMGDPQIIQSWNRPFLVLKQPLLLGITSNPCPSSSSVENFIRGWRKILPVIQLLVLTIIFSMEFVEDFQKTPWICHKAIYVTLETTTNPPWLSMFSLGTPPQPGQPTSNPWKERASPALGLPLVQALARQCGACCQSETTPGGLFLRRTSRPPRRKGGSRGSESTVWHGEYDCDLPVECDCDLLNVWVEKNKTSLHQQPQFGR